MGWIAVLAAWQTGCDGVIGDTKYDGPELPRTVDPMTCGLPEDPADPATGPLRLLSNDELVDTLAMILGDELDVRPLLPPDSEIGGRSRFPGNAGRAVDDQGLAALKLVAEAASQVVRENLARYTTCGAAVDEACARAALTRLARLAYRRPPAPASIDALMAVYALGETPEEGMELATSAMFQSPRFLYHVELGTDGEALDSFELASRLAFFVTGRGPDEALIDAAEEGVLRDAEAVERLARELFHSDAGRRHTIRQLVRWIGVERIRPKVPGAFPGVAVDARALEALEASMGELLYEQVYVDENAIGQWFVDRPASEVGDSYALDTPETPRAGLLTHPAWLAAFSGGEGNVPTSRGKFVATELLCMQIELPTGLDVVIPPVMPDDGVMTTRQRFEQHGTMPCARACHGVMDPLGYAFENFDAIGRFQVTENSRPIDASGSIELPSLGLSGTFSNARELSEMLARSDAVLTCFTERWLEQALSRPALDDEACAIARMSDAVQSNGGTLEELTVAIVSSDAFRRRTPNREGEGGCR